jgi:hypothetical protein
MKPQYISTSGLLAVFVGTVVLMSPVVATWADGPEGPLVPRIGPKSEAVVRNDLRVLGLPARRVKLSGNTAKAQIPVQGEMASIEIDRRTGSVRIIEASPRVRQVLESRVPRVQLIKEPVRVSPIGPIRPGPSIRVVPRLRHPAGPQR